jgi:uncharacterized membrane protein YjgN (DUF898 family)
VNFLLGLITLGFYRFWAKTNVRKHIWSCVHINGEPLEYTGTGLELFKGFMVVFGVFILPYGLLVAVATIMQGQMSHIAVVLKGLFFLAIYVLWGFAVYRARKYQLSRTKWRGIRGTLVGSAMIYSMLYFGSMLAKGISLYWATPVMNTVLAEQITNDMRFGDAAFKFKGRAGPLYPTFAACWFLTLLALVSVVVLIIYAEPLSHYFPTVFDSSFSIEAVTALLAFGAFALFVFFMLIVPCLWAIYSAKEMRTFATYTRFDGVPFTLNATAGGIIWLTTINLLLIVFTLGIAWPFVQQRVVEFVVDRLKLEGLIDIDRIRQSSAKLDTRGEGLADAFDIGGL